MKKLVLVLSATTLLGLAACGTFFGKGKAWPPPPHLLSQRDEVLLSTALTKGGLAALLLLAL